MGGPDTAPATGTSGGGGTRLKFHDTELELSALPDVQIEAGAMVLRFQNYSGTITLRPGAPAAAAAAGGGEEEEDMLLAQLDEELLEAEAEAEEGKENAGPVIEPVEQEQEPEEEEEEEEEAAGGGGNERKQQQGAAGGGKRGGGAGAGKKAPAPAAAAVTPKGKGKGDKVAAAAGSGSGGRKQPRQQKAAAAEQEQQQQQQQPEGGSARKKPRRGASGGAQQEAAAAGNSSNPLASPAPSTATSHPSSSPLAPTTTTSNTTSANDTAAAAPTRGSPPQGRWGHSATVVGDGRMVVYGGEGDDPATGAACTFGDLFVFELDADGKAGKWERPLNCDSIPRCWHSATFLPGKNLLVAFGGERMGEGGVPEVLDDIMALDTELFLWYPPAISGKPPTARSGHTASLVGKDIVIFGGSRGRKWCVNTVQCLDVERWSWRSPSIYGNGPPGRSYHSATVVGGHKVVYFGGNDGGRCYNRVHVLQVGGVPGGPKDWEWFHPEVVGRAPAPRTGHAACLLGDGKTILVQGGWDPQDASSDDTKVFEDAFLLDTEQWEWTPIPVAQAQQLQAEADEQQQAQQQQQAAPAGLLEGGALVPSPGFRVGHTAVLVGAGSKEEGQGGKGEGRVLVFGGQDRLGVRREDLLVVKY